MTTHRIYNDLLSMFELRSFYCCKFSTIIIKIIIINYYRVISCITIITSLLFSLKISRLNNSLYNAKMGEANTQCRIPKIALQIFINILHMLLVELLLETLLA